MQIYAIYMDISGIVNTKFLKETGRIQILSINRKVLARYRIHVGHWLLVLLFLLMLLVLLLLVVLLVMLVLLALLVASIASISRAGNFVGTTDGIHEV